MDLSATYRPELYGRWAPRPFQPPQPLGCPPKGLRAPGRPWSLKNHLNNSAVVPVRQSWETAVLRKYKGTPWNWHTNENKNSLSQLWQLCSTTWQQKHSPRM